MATDVQDVLGAPIKRVEDPRFITGKGRYLDDIKLTGMTHMAILRSPYAHANIRSIDTSAATSMPGVLAAIVGADISWNPLPMAWPAGGSVRSPPAIGYDGAVYFGTFAGRLIALHDTRTAVEPRQPGAALARSALFAHYGCALACQGDSLARGARQRFAV